VPEPSFLVILIGAFCFLLSVRALRFRSQTGTPSGYQALRNNGTANYDLAVGYGVGSSLTTGSSNIRIASPGILNLSP
jgi:hypothetical protein